MNHSSRIALTMIAFTLIGAIGRATGESEAPLPATGASVPAAGIGAWTTDWAAAVKVAQERKLPLFLQFTGSDWCGWCQKMERECFSKPEFLEAMKSR